MEDLLDKKITYFSNIKKITESYRFTGSDDEADNYISMIENRELLFSKIREIDALLKENGYDATAENVELQKQIEGVVKEIIELDKKNKPIIDKIRQTLAFKVNGVKKGKAITKAYSSYIETSSFDSKR